MESNLTFGSLAALFGAMVVLASVPSVSVLAVSVRAATAGFWHGALTAGGIVAGDIVFIVVAISGLSVLADLLSSLFVLVKYLGGAYLIWLGIALWRSKPGAVEIEALAAGSSRLSSFLTGLVITLGDLKAIFFYLGFFPAFLELSTISMFDIAVIIVITTVAVGGIKLGYAFIADRAGLVLNRFKTKRIINLAAGAVMMGVGLFLLFKA